jgi:predicted nucleotidyltransferase component of viral defense system
MEFLPEEVITELATILAVDPAFAEKDGVAVQVLSRLNKISTPKASLVFGRGTSLSKAHGIIERFSEDLDFRVWPTNGAGNLNKGPRSRFRRKVLAELKDMEKEGGITLEARESGGNYLKIKLNYHQAFDLPRALRKSLLLELSFTPLQRSARILCRQLVFITKRQVSPLRLQLAVFHRLK